VAKRHGEVTREIWHSLWPERDVSRVPVGHVTNGVHLPTWMSARLARLLDRELGDGWMDHRDEPAKWERVLSLDDAELWGLHRALKAKLFDFVRDDARRRWSRAWTEPSQVAGAGTLLDPDALTIGFARRFATYKRAGLIFSELERLLALPLQVVVAGKAHPADDPGKDVMQGIIEIARESRAQGRVVFLENYDIGLARTLVRGCDVWLNTPRRPLEASGTSGMKAAVNGVLNLSVLDGWWAEGYSPDRGWAIDGTSDEGDREQLYRLLEEQVVPTFTEDRERWIEMMKTSIAELAPRFSMQRAVIDYVERYYLPAHHAAVRR
jgi:starch phosphorylase